MTVFEQYWDVYLYFLIWLAVSVWIERLQRQHYLRKGGRDDR